MLAFLSLTTALQADEPVITNEPKGKIQTGQTYSYIPTVTDDDEGDIAAYIAFELIAGEGLEEIPDWITFNTETGQVSGTPAYEDAGYIELGIKVTTGVDENRDDDTFWMELEIDVAPSHGKVFLEDGQEYRVNEGTSGFSIVPGDDVAIDDADFEKNIDFTTNSNIFGITTDGQLYVRKGAVLDFEAFKDGADEEYEIEVTARDRVSGNSDTTTVLIIINDLDEEAATPDVSNHTFLLEEQVTKVGKSTGFFVSNVASDPLEFTTDSEQFTIDLTTGEIFFAREMVLNDGNFRRLRVTVKNTEGGGAEPATITVRLDVVELGQLNAGPGRSGSAPGRRKKSGTCLISSFDNIMWMLFSILGTLILIPFMKTSKEGN